MAPPTHSNRLYAGGCSLEPPGFFESRRAVRPGRRHAGIRLGRSDEVVGEGHDPACQPERAGVRVRYTYRRTIDVEPSSAPSSIEAGAPSPDGRREESFSFSLVAAL